MYHLETRSKASAFIDPSAVQTLDVRNRASKVFETKRFSIMFANKVSQTLNEAKGKQVDEKSQHPRTAPSEKTGKSALKSEKTEDKQLTADTQSTQTGATKKEVDVEESDTRKNLLKKGKRSQLSVAPRKKEPKDAPKEKKEPKDAPKQEKEVVSPVIKSLVGNDRSLTASGVDVL